MSGKRDWLFRIDDMITHIEKVQKLLDSKSRKHLYEDETLEKAVERYYEIIGEAARFVPKDICQKYDQIYWSDIIGMRHRISHDYDDVDNDVLWDTYENDLEPLKQDLINLLKEESQ